MEFVEFYNEHIQYENPFLSLKIFEAQRDQEYMSRWHYHKELELLAIVEGRLDVYVEDELFRLEQGGVALIGSSQLHRDRSYASEKLVYLVLQFDLEQALDQSTMPYFRFFSETRSPLSRLNHVLAERPDARQIVYDAVCGIYREWTDKQEGYELAVSILVKRILLTLLRGGSGGGASVKENADLIRLKPVFDYVERNLEGKIIVEEASRAANISYYYFVKYFKKALGMSFMEYVHRQKIKKAEKLLLTKTISVAQVANRSGCRTWRIFTKCSASSTAARRTNTESGCWSGGGELLRSFCGRRIAPY
ncbi:AraC family transcriptional regulator [Gordoniibacillus kamchatkensis]|uniref:AraC family transcriptional regulator n=1 Tax=Gordoniibacillus kamchatkensis TaxID=1590651 RepID=UPI001E377B52|nr:AraC family transcriptional regulator [Paenibacillus sp. VKM B-2647]